MNPQIPKAAAIILDFIGATEVGTAGRKGYDTIYNHQQHRLRKPITSMTILEVQQGQIDQWDRMVKSSATGRYQFMYKTLGGLIEDFKLDIHQKFEPDIQDSLGFILMKRRGYAKWVSHKISDVTFALGLAKEWASFPVLQPVKGAHRALARGQSYYEGDRLNKSLITPEQVEAMLKRARACLVRGANETPNVAPPPTTEPTTPLRPPEGPPLRIVKSPSPTIGLIISFIVGVAAFGAYLYFK